MNPRIVRWLVVGVLGLSAGVGRAADTGFYGIASLGQGDESPKSAGINLGGFGGVIHLDPDRVDVDDGDVAWSFGLGYRINRHLSGEIEYVDFGRTDITEQYLDDGGPAPIILPTNLSVRLSSHVTGPLVSLLGRIPVNAHVELIVRGGALFAARQMTSPAPSSLDETFATTTWLVGAGASASVGMRWAVRAEYQRSGALDKSVVTGETRLARATLSVLYSF